MIHDYDHSGTTNNFHIQSNSKLSILYNDRSVLENHHVAAFFRTMVDNECNILSNMSRADFREFRSLMIEMVLHTGNAFLTIFRGNIVNIYLCLPREASVLAYLLYFLKVREGVKKN